MTPRTRHLRSVPTGSELPRQLAAPTRGRPADDRGPDPASRSSVPRSDPASRSSVPRSDPASRSSVPRSDPASRSSASVDDWAESLRSLTATDIQNLLGQLGRIAQQLQPDVTPPPRRPRLRIPVTFRVRVDVDDIRPPIWRRLDLASDLALDELHEILQLAFGWTDSHLHAFSFGGRMHEATSERYLTESDVEEGDEGVLEASVRLDEVLADPGDRLFYSYDFGDGWEHTIKLEAVSTRCPDDPPALCLRGRRAGPVEDCGGPWGYQDLIDASHPRVAHANQFDLEEINEGLRDLLS